MAYERKKENFNQRVLSLHEFVEHKTAETWVILKDFWQNVYFDLVSLLGSWQDSGKTVG
jgi:hypothetical protein